MRRSKYTAIEVPVFRSKDGTLRSLLMDPWRVNTFDTYEDFVGITLYPRFSMRQKKVGEGPVMKDCMNGDV